MKKQSLQDDFISFKAGVKTLCLATLDHSAKPRASYTPFVEGEDGCFYIFVSQLAAHTQDLLAQPAAGILLLEDEQDARQIFARQRLSYQCHVEVVDPETSLYKAMLDAMEARFGNVLELLRSLPDFILFRLIPYEGQYVKGFGKAYKLVGTPDGKGLQKLEHITSSS